MGAAETEAADTETERPPAAADLGKLPSPLIAPDEVVVVRYRRSCMVKATLLAVALLGLGAWFSEIVPSSTPADNAARVIVAVLAAILLVGGAYLLGAAIQMWRSDGRPLVIDSECISVRYPYKRHFRFPWSEITGCRVRTYERSSGQSVEIAVRAPTREYRVTPSRWSLASRERFTLTDSFVIRAPQLAELIQSRLASWDEMRGRGG
jgi:Bacterial PH domain